MNISYNWLKDLIELDLPADETAPALTRVGLAVEAIHAFGDDQVFDIDITSNRPDCLSHLGVARELSVITGRPLKVIDKKGQEGFEAPMPSILAADIVKIECPELCYRFTARIIRGVKIGPSPEWLVKRLEAVGERSINNVADITNLVMLELGQPMHAFDVNKLEENRIVVRQAKPGETIVTLDEAERKLDEEMVVICDAERPQAIGGVMGGIDSSITDETTEVLIEVACFKRESVRAASRKLGLTTEASYRFERGVDIENLKRASDRAAELICELAGGMPGEFVDVYPNKQTFPEVTSHNISAAVLRFTGLDVPTDDCIRILNALGIAESEATTGEDRVFASPSWRHDIAIEEDLVEEVARHHGYEKIAEELPPAYGAGEYQPTEPRKRKIRRCLADLGFDEAMSYSFIDVKHDGIFAEVPGLLNGSATRTPYVELRDSVIEGAVRMRTSLLPGLLDSVRLNLNHRRKDLKLFEIGKVFSAAEDGALPTERELLAIVLTGGYILEQKELPSRELDFYDAKGAVEAVFSSAGSSVPTFQASEISHLRSGQAGTIQLNETEVGSIGRLNEEIAANYKFKEPVYVAEVDLQKVLETEPEPARYAVLPRYPSVVRDVSFLISRTTTFDEIISAALAKRPDILESVSFVDVFEGKGLGENERSLTLRFQYRSNSRTLTEGEASSTHEAVVKQVKASLPVTVRK